MIRGYYTLDMYCDSGKDHPYIINGDVYGFPQNFTGASRQACYMKAARAGWTLSPKKHICPWCNGRLKEDENAS